MIIYHFKKICPLSTRKQMLIHDSQKSHNFKLAKMCKYYERKEIDDTFYLVTFQLDISVINNLIPIYF